MADDDWMKGGGTVHTWTDTDRPQMLDETVPLTTPAPQPETGGGVGRDLSVAGTRFAGTPFDIISNVKPYVLDPAVNFLHNRLGLPTGPEIPIPTTEYQRNAYGVAPPQNREERIADTVGQAAGTAVSSLAIPGAGGGAALSAGTGSLASGLSQEFFPDSMALQLIASGISGLGSAAIARQLLFGGGLRATLAQAGGVTNALVRDYIGRAVGAGLSHLTGLPEILSTEIGGLAGLLSHNIGRSIVRSVFSRQGARSTGYGLLGGALPEIDAQRARDNWQNNLTGPTYTGSGLQ